jgi:predicted ribosomally synthesized peptide with SipW-like signal peptide
MKKWLTILGTLTAIAALVGIGAFGVFSDTETAVGNTFTAGTLDLKVDGGDTPITMAFSTDNMSPGNNYDGGCVTLNNAGTIAGVLGVEVENLVSNENGLIEPEIDAGDAEGVEADPDSYFGNTGDGELWDQISVGFCLEAGAGSHSSNGHCDWDDIRFKAPGSTHDDYSSTYSIHTNFDYAASHNVILQPGESAVLCTEVTFFDDESSHFWIDGYANNTAMSDDAMLDFVFSLVQAP